MSSYTTKTRCILITCLLMALVLAGCAQNYNGGEESRHAYEERQEGQEQAQAVQSPQDQDMEQEQQPEPVLSPDTATTPGGKKMEEETAGDQAAETAVVPRDDSLPKGLKETVLITIHGYPAGEYILTAGEVELEAGDSVMDILLRVAKMQDIQLGFRGRGASSYVQGINNLYEFDHGPGSGWIYRVNDHFPSRSPGAWKVENGDHIEWFYTQNMGRDIGATPFGGS